MKKVMRKNFCRKLRRNLIRKKIQKISIEVFISKSSRYGAVKAEKSGPKGNISCGG